MDKTSRAVDDISTNFAGMKSKMSKQEENAAGAEKAVKAIKNSIESLNKMIEGQSDSINASFSAVEQMTANIHSVSKTLMENSRNVNELTEAPENGKTGLQTVAGEIQEIALESEGLLKINAVMDNIASQTNLLSMNAANEAAHAGEAGKGFVVLAMTKGALEKDYDVTTVSSGKEAFNLFLHGYVPNLVLLDLSMPEMGGWDTFIRIRNISKLHQSPIAIYSTSDDPKDRAKAKELEAVDFIHKPAKKAELLEKVARLVRQ